MNKLFYVIQNNSLLYVKLFCVTHQILFMLNFDKNLMNF